MANDKIVTKRGIYLYINGKEINNDIKSIRGEMKRLQNEQAKMTIGSEQYARTGEKIKALDRILQKHRSEWRSTNSEVEKTKSSILSLGKITDTFNKYFGMFTAFIASITGLTFAIRKCVDDFAELEESEADVRKYTGMTRDEVKDLNEEFKKMDTRTARTALNAFASDAGRLGLQTKKEILEFVEAANIIKIALGEDLGEDAVKNIGKLSNLFGITDEKGLKEGMIATASAINELAQNSSASEPYLLNFTARLAGTGKQANISMTQIMGYASVLDQDMQQVEMSSTALQKVILKMYKAPADFARIAGKDVTEFTRLLKEDANEAFLQFLSGLNNPEGMLKLAPILEELKLEGSRASGVLGNLATSVDRIRIEQEIASEAFNEGTSVIDEYNVKNNTLQATIEKAKKKFKEMSYELGEKLAPHVSKLISNTSTLLKVISVLFDFIVKHSGVLITLLSTITAYITAKKLLYVWNQRHIILNKILSASILDLNVRYQALNAVHRLLIGNLKGAKESFLQLTSALKLNPWVLLVTAVTGAAVALYQWYKNAKDAASLSGQLTKLYQDVAKSISEETTNLKLLLSVARDEKESKDKRESAIKAINEISPEYLGNLTLEKINTEEATTAIEEYTKALEANAKMKALSNKLAEIEQKKLEALWKLEEMADVQEQFDKAIVGSESYRIFERKLGVVHKEIKELNEESEFFLKIYGELSKTMSKPINRTGTTGEESGTTYVPGQELDDKELRKVLQKGTEALENEYAKRSNEIKQQYIKRQITESQMQEKLWDEEMFFLFSKKQLYEQYKQDVSQIEETISDKIIAETKRREKEAKKNKITPEPEEEDKNPLWKELAKGIEVQIAMNEALYAKGLISHQEYTYRKAKLDEQYRKEKKAKDKKAAEEEMRVREAVLSAVSSFANSAATYVKIAQSKEEQAIEDKYKYKLILAEGDNEATAALEEEKEAELLAIRKKYADKAFAMQVLSITAETAVAAMRAYSAALELGFAGIPLAPIMAAAAIAAGMVQIASANQQREQAAQMWSGGYTGDGGKYEPKKLIQTHGGEFVATKETVQILRPMFDVIDQAQRTGNVASLKGPEMAQALGSATLINRPAINPVLATGQQPNTSGTDIGTVLRENMAVIGQLKARLDQPIISETYIDGPRGVQKSMNEYNKLLKNASRR